MDKIIYECKCGKDLIMVEVECPVCGNAGNEPVQKLIDKTKENSSKRVAEAQEDTARLMFLFSGTMSLSNAATALERRMLSGENLTIKDVRDGIDDVRGGVPNGTGWMIPREIALGTTCYHCASIFPGFNTENYKCHCTGTCPALADTRDEALIRLGRMRAKG